MSEYITTAEAYRGCESAFVSFGANSDSREQECQICYDDIVGGSLAVTHLTTCRTTWHRECFDRYFDSGRNEEWKTELLCPNCRSVLRTFREFKVILSAFHEPVQYVKDRVAEPQMIFEEVNLREGLQELPIPVIDFLTDHTSQEEVSSWCSWIRISYKNSNDVFMIPVTSAQWERIIQHMYGMILDGKLKMQTQYRIESRDDIAPLAPAAEPSLLD